MRLWSLHPRYLDVKGLQAAWREGLLARAVLSGNTRGYRNHPQLNRFKTQDDPLQAIDYFLEQIYLEACRRGYHFDSSKFHPGGSPSQIPVTEGQIAYEKEHLRQKLLKRDLARIDALLMGEGIELNPLFTDIPGTIEEWEKRIES